jgi:Ca-activated chloride channel homolog
MMGVGFSHPWLLLLGVLPVLLPAVCRIPKLRGRGKLSLPTYDWLPAFAQSSPHIRNLAGLLRIMGLFCLVLIAAGIRYRVSTPTAEPQPEALVIVLDVSSSMTAEDFAPGNRLEVAKNLLTGFVTSHANADLGLILLAASPHLMVPVTGENLALVRALKVAQPAGFGEDGTAIGSGIASAVNRLRQGPWAKRSILLVTDGVNNRGELAPSDAARLAARMGIRIDTVGIGTDMVSRYWVPSAPGSTLEVKARIQIDDKALEEVSNIAGGSYRRVTNSDELNRALKSLKIGSPTSITTVTAHYDDAWKRMAALAALLLICSEFILLRFVSPELPG